MVIRSGIGGSLPYETSSEKLLEVFRTGKWTSNIPLWEILPLPLDQPLLRKHWSRRRDLIWMDRQANIKKQIEDVWPELGHPLPNGLFYSKSKKLRLFDREGLILRTISDIRVVRILTLREWGAVGVRQIQSSRGVFTGGFAGVGMSDSLTRRI